jgi:AcrR family transcriptional regulator
VRDRLLDAASALFARRGYAAVPIREIARSAGVTSAMVHYYFGDKRALYHEMLERALGRVLERVRRVVAERTGGEAGLVGLLEVVQGALAADPWIPPLVLREVLSEEGRFRERFVEIYASQLARIVPGLIESEIRAGRFRADLDPRLAFLSFVALMAFPFVARPVIERALGIDYDADFPARLAAHSRRMFLEGVRR